MANKMTKKDYFAILRETYPTDASNYDEVIAFIDHEVDLLDRKKSASRKPTAQQTANESIKDAIYDFMVEHPTEKYTITDIQKQVAECAELTGQKISALVRQMTMETDGRVVRTEEKRKAYFSANQ